MNVSAAVLTIFLEELFLAAGLSNHDARLCANIHVLQEMRGVTTHGLRHVRHNLEGLTKGHINPRPHRTILRDQAATVVLDGDAGVGIGGCMEAMDRAISKAKQFGIGIGIVIHSNHFLSAAPYCLRAIEQDLIGFCFSNTWGAMGYPGTEVRAIGNAPIGFGVPGTCLFPIVFDAALTTSGGKLQEWIRKGQAIPRGLLGIDEEGKPSSDPTAVLWSGTPWPIGDHKGAGLAVMVEILTGLLGGGSFLRAVQPPHLRTSKENSESQCCIAIDIAKFMPLTVFRERIEAFVCDLKNNPLSPGCSEILLPGERAHNARLSCMRNGVPVDEEVAAMLRGWAQELTLTCPF
jgi:LDH2 family malate/lactate/ureidoglycolate dehydrogenase